MIGRSWRSALATSLAVALSLVLTGAHVDAQEQAGGGQEIRIDSIAVEGNNRISRDDVLTRIDLRPGQAITIAEIQETVKSLMATGEFEDVRVHALGDPGEAVTIVLRVREQPLLRRVVIRGLEHIDAGEVQDSSGLQASEPLSEAKLTVARQVIQERLAEEGIPFARIQDRVESVEGMTGVADLIIEVEEGNRVAVSQVVVRGNEEVPTEDITGAMATSPEGFWWFQAGGYEEEGYNQDLAQRIPGLYHSRGYLDFQILSDTLVVDPETGKARVELEVEEGPQYRVARFSIEGNRYFEDERLESYFRQDEGGLLRSLGIGGGEERDAERRGRVFDQLAFQDAVGQVETLYRNQGYLFVQVQPFVEKIPAEEPGEDPSVATGVRIQEGQPAYIDEIRIEGNDYTHEWVIRDKILLLPGDVYSEERVLQSYQSIQALGFFETPLPIPGIDADPETGEVDITFRVVEQQTGAVNFGTSVGGGVGLSGFIGYDQPNLFGQAKEGHLRWDFGRFLNSFTLSFTDPALFRSRVSGSIDLFNSTNRFFQFRSGRRRRIGTNLRFGFPISGWLRTRFFVGYSISRSEFELREGVDDTSLFGQPPGTQSAVSLGLTRTTLNHPIFPTSGSRQNLNVEFNGGPLGGDGNFQKITAEGKWRQPVGQLGGGPSGGGGSPLILSFGLGLRSGFLYGDVSNFPFDRFWMGGVQFGERLRGYDETSITPRGIFPERSTGIADIERLGNAFLSMTADFSMKLNNNIQLSTFFDAGNVWESPGRVDPTRLFRGAGFGIQLVTPFGPIGIDYAYGFDKPEPGWQFHFRMGPGF